MAGILHHLSSGNSIYRLGGVFKLAHFVLKLYKDIKFVIGYCISYYKHIFRYGCQQNIHSKKKQN